MAFMFKTNIVTLLNDYKNSKYKKIRQVKLPLSKLNIGRKRNLYNFYIIFNKTPHLIKSNFVISKSGL